ncbi:hypothetical protein TELCIR_20261, partial [Teladorsagia circumcincta]
MLLVLNALTATVFAWSDSTPTPVPLPPSLDNAVTNLNQNIEIFLVFNSHILMAESECDVDWSATHQLGPEKSGVEQSITIIISFHSTFITKVDRAYRCTCFYLESDKLVTSKFEVSMLPSTDLTDTVRMPLCTYTVRRESINGPVVQFAQVGDQVFHVWQCES